MSPFFLNTLCKIQCLCSWLQSDFIQDLWFGVTSFTPLCGGSDVIRWSAEKWKKGTFSKMAFVLSGYFLDISDLILLSKATFKFKVSSLLKCLMSKALWLVSSQFLSEVAPLQWPFFPSIMECPVADVHFPQTWLFLFCQKKVCIDIGGLYCLYTNTQILCSAQIRLWGMSAAYEVGILDSGAYTYLSWNVELLVKGRQLDL